MALQKPTILIIGTLDTKLVEILYLKTQILASSNGSCLTKVLNVSRNGRNAADYPGIPAVEILQPLADIASDLHPIKGDDYERSEDLDKAVEHCIPVVGQLVSDSKIQGIVGVGGSTGSMLASAIMRNACPIGFPKLLISTMASGDTKPYIQETDIAVMYSVVDIAGLNSILKHILSNGAGAIVGMTSAYVLQRREDDRQKNASGSSRKRIAVTTFQVTRPCVETIRTMLTSTPHDVTGHEILVFHASGSGGQAMERLIGEGQIDAVIDLTTTEITDEVVGGALTAGPTGLEAAVKKGIPTVISVGACNIVNFGPKHTVPQHHADRDLYEVAPTVTLMRTTAEENQKILPTGNISMLDAEGRRFHDPKGVADEALFQSIKVGLRDSGIEVHENPNHINSEDFAREVCEHILELMGISPRVYRLANARRRQWSFNHGPSVEAVRRASLIDIPDVS